MDLVRSWDLDGGSSGQVSQMSRGWKKICLSQEES